MVWKYFFSSEIKIVFFSLIFEFHLKKVANKNTVKIIWNTTGF